MRIACVGAGPGGLFFAVLATRIPGVTDVTVFERAAEGAPRGWGVVFWPDLVAQVEAVDPPFAESLREFRYTWHDQVVELDGSDVRFTASGYAMGRHLMQKLLVDRAREVGVRVEFERPIGRAADLEGYDLVVAADGVRSVLRDQASAIRTEVVEGRNRYIWLGTEKQFSSFSFPFVKSPAGWLWAHAYAFGEAGSTFIVETTEETWRALGLDTLGPDETLRLLESTFAEQLDGHKLVLQEEARGTAPWRRFATVRNSAWTDGTLALVGDAAHTTHFSVGSGTRLALEDAIALARHLEQAPTLAEALAGYGRERAEALEVTARQARSSAAWFEAVPRYVERPARDFARLLVERRRFVARRTPGLYLALHRLTTVPVLGAAINRTLAVTRTVLPRVVGPLRRRFAG
ncbi:FAD-dependent monooxygenase [Pseudonocardia halophobica]|uniref:FAD-binding monooxygenase n=1 Tax=Pseudonocardia halophobica TaxID=29401 RepID=A0A9W6L4H5_9PSEU|nr:FAD-dependent monooxygenase [Pseudonocardia halophobica]GLL10929.1 FAD-binding monooxygenase [Pseudonocardia halophobica]